MMIDNEKIKVFDFIKLFDNLYKSYKYTFIEYIQIK
jgi:hypothetical protein